MVYKFSSVASVSAVTTTLAGSIFTKSPATFSSRWLMKTETPYSTLPSGEVTADKTRSHHGMLCTPLPPVLQGSSGVTSAALLAAARSCSRRLLPQIHGDQSSRTDNILLTCISAKNFITGVIWRLINVS